VVVSLNRSVQRLKFRETIRRKCRSGCTIKNYRRTEINVSKYATIRVYCVGISRRAVNSTTDPSAKSLISRRITPNTKTVFVFGSAIGQRQRRKYGYAIFTGRMKKAYARNLRGKNISYARLMAGVQSSCRVNKSSERNESRVETFGVFRHERNAIFIKRSRIINTHFGRTRRKFQNECISLHVIKYHV